MNKVDDIIISSFFIGLIILMIIGHILSKFTDPSYIVVMGVLGEVTGLLIICILRNIVLPWLKEKRLKDAEKEKYERQCLINEIKNQRII